MEFEDYRVKATVTATYPDLGENLVYPALGLAGEAGEVVEKVKKLYRKTGYLSPKLTQEEKDEIKKELGDVLWYIAALCTELKLDMNEVAAQNIRKLLDRHERNVIVEEGDNR